ncbi:hypothetical protein CAPTEDRAFT_157684 [Capitella teleta]|uniref:Nicalin n=1 Tax=Capitella teleta TaxID=283909 RepID=R7V9R8_CAPTE|nr:hypothetical protein CAPTEDRAFT_157684 [Capitella teleta]|eukprot:ELU15334.1 hypothetical protein CAPTEDRAFT_157684 [Capitella teleta]
MWLLDEASGELLAVFSVPLLIFLIIVSPSADAASDFTVFRTQHYDLQGTAYGCHSGLVNVEARPIESNSYTRRCVIARLKDVTMVKYREMLIQNAAALLVALPEDLQDLTDREREHLAELELEMLAEENQLPVYFTTDSHQITHILNDVASSINADSAASAAEAMLSSASANGLQMLVTGAASKALNDFQVVNIQGKLSGFGIEEQLPTIALVAHYDAYSLVPSLSYGADSDASGVVTLLELSRLFSKLYTNSRTHAKFNLLFLLSGGGKFNYQGTRRWIEDQLESSEASLLSDVHQVICFDSIAKGDGLHLHVSKPPKEGSAGHSIANHLEQSVRSVRGSDAAFSVVHKKINLAEELLSWEHERFSLRRLPALSLSHFDSHKDQKRQTLLDTRETVSDETLVQNIQVVAEALAKHIFNLTSEEGVELFSDGLRVEPSLVSAWLSHLTSVPRAQQLLPPSSPLLHSLEHAFSRHLKEVKRHMVVADKRDPEFLFYSGQEYTMSAYSVKPAIFDLFLAVGIAAYLAVLYVAVQNFHLVYAALRMISGSNGNKAKKIY